MTLPPDRIGVVLAGGRSRRMGQDKARMTLDRDEVTGPSSAASERLGASRRSTWLEQTLSLLAPHVTECWVVGREVTTEDCPSWIPLPPSRRDGRPGVGPLAGIETALQLAASREVLVAACDLPALTSRVIEELIRAAGATPGASAIAFRAPSDTDSRERLAGLLLLLRPAALSPLSALLDHQEYRVERFLREIGAHWIDPDPELLRALRNANRPQDLLPEG